MNVLFVGDIVGDPGVAFAETHVPRLRDEHDAELVVANAENAAITGPNPVSGCGMSHDAVARLFAAGVDVITGGNHSWDGPEAASILERDHVLRPLNYGTGAPGRGSLRVERNGSSIGIVNLTSRSALQYADAPYDALESQLNAWDGQVEYVLVDFHGASVSEKQIFAWSFAGRVAAVLGTHTHVATLDTRILPGGTAYVTDVGMTGPTGGMQGYQPDPFISAIRTRLPIRQGGGVAEGPVILGAVLLTLGDGGATAIQRIECREGGTSWG